MSLRLVRFPKRDKEGSGGTESTSSSKPPPKSPKPVISKPSKVVVRVNKDAVEQPLAILSEGAAQSLHTKASAFTATPRLRPGDEAGLVEDSSSIPSVSIPPFQSTIEGSGLGQNDLPPMPISPRRLSAPPQVLSTSPALHVPRPQALSANQAASSETSTRLRRTSSLSSGVAAAVAVRRSGSVSGMTRTASTTVGKGDTWGPAPHVSGKSSKQEVEQILDRPEPFRPNTADVDAAALAAAARAASTRAPPSTPLEPPMSRIPIKGRPSLPPSSSKASSRPSIVPLLPLGKLAPSHTPDTSLAVEGAPPVSTTPHSTAPSSIRGKSQQQHQAQPSSPMFQPQHGRDVHAPLSEPPPLPSSSKSSLNKSNSTGTSSDKAQSVLQSLRTQRGDNSLLTTALLNAPASLAPSLPLGSMAATSQEYDLGAIIGNLSTANPTSWGNTDDMSIVGQGTSPPNDGELNGSDESDWSSEEEQDLAASLRAQVGRATATSTPRPPSGLDDLDLNSLSDDSDSSQRSTDSLLSLARDFEEEVEQAKIRHQVRLAARAAGANAGLLSTSNLPAIAESTSPSPTIRKLDSSIVSTMAESASVDSLADLMRTSSVPSVLGEPAKAPIKSLASAAALVRRKLLSGQPNMTGRRLSKSASSPDGLDAARVPSSSHQPSLVVGSGPLSHMGSPASRKKPDLPGNVASVSESGPSMKLGRSLVDSARRQTSVKDSDIGGDSRRVKTPTRVPELIRNLGRAMAPSLHVSAVAVPKSRITADAAAAQAAQTPPKHGVEGTSTPTDPPGGRPATLDSSSDFSSSTGLGRSSSLTSFASSMSFSSMASGTSKVSRFSSKTNPRAVVNMPEDSKDTLEWVLREFEWPPELMSIRRELHVTHGSNWNALIKDVFPGSTHRTPASKEDLTEQLTTLQQRVDERIAKAESGWEALRAGSTPVARLTVFDVAERVLAHYMAIGVWSARLEDYDAAVAAFDVVIKTIPTHIEARFWRGLSYALSNQHTSLALADLEQVIKMNQKFPFAYRIRADLRSLVGNTHGALHDYNDAVRVNKSDALAYWMRAGLYEQLGDSEQAASNYRSVLKLKPTCLEALFRHGAFLMTTKQWRAAFRDFNEAVRLCPTSREAFYRRAEASARMDQMDDALEDLTRAIELDPDHGPSFVLRGLLTRVSDPEHSVQDLSIALMLDYNVADAYFQRGLLYGDLHEIWLKKKRARGLKLPGDRKLSAQSEPKSGEAEEATVEETYPNYASLALADYERALQINDEHVQAHVNAGVLKMTYLGDLDGAIESFTAALKLEPRYSRALYCRADAYSRQGRSSLAVRDYGRVAHLNPTTHSTYVFRGRMLMETKNTLLSMHDFVATLQLNPKMAKTNSQRAQVHSLFRQHDQAIDLYKAAIKETPQAVDLHLALGKTKIKAGDLVGALASFTDAIKLRPSDPKCFLTRARGYKALGQFSKAIQDLTSALKLDRRLVAAWLERAANRFLSQSGDYGLSDIMTALKLDPRNVGAYLLRAEVQAAQGRYGKAIADYTSAVSVDPSSVRGFVNRGLAKHLLGQPERAVRDFTMATCLDPDCSVAFYNRANARQALGMHEGAIRDYSIALMLSPDLVDAYRNRGLLYWMCGQPASAITDLTWACNHAPRDLGLLVALGECYHVMGDFDSAEQVYERALWLDSRFLNALLGRGNVSFDKGTKRDVERAVRDYRVVLAVDPTHVQARINFGYALHTLGRLQEAWSIFSTAIALDEKNSAALEGRAMVSLRLKSYYAAYKDITAALEERGGDDAELLTNRGVVHLRMGDVLRAISDFRQALEVDPSFSLANFNLGTVYMSRKEYEKAVHCYSSALERNPGSQSVRTNRGISQAAIGDFEAALADFSEVVDSDPGAANGHYNRAAVLMKLNRWEEAESDLEHAMELSPNDALFYAKRGKALGGQARIHEALVAYNCALTLDEGVDLS